MRKASEDALNLLLMRNTGYQKVKRNGVFIDYHGDKIWYHSAKETWRILGDKVCVRYTPDDLRSVRLYDTEDRYLGSWDCADWLIMQYFEEDHEAVGTLERNQHETMRNIKERTAELKGEPMITQKMGLAYCAKKNAGKFTIRTPKNIYPVTVSEPIEQKKAAGAENVKAVQIDLKQMRQSAIERKKGNS